MAKGHIRSLFSWNHGYMHNAASPRGRYGEQNIHTTILGDECPID